MSFCTALSSLMLVLYKRLIACQYRVNLIKVSTSPYKFDTTQLNSIQIQDTFTFSVVNPKGRSHKPFPPKYSWDEVSGIF